MHTTIEQLYEIYKQHNSVKIDSRKTEAGDLFFALKGPNFDGNKYAESALKKGAENAIIDNPAYQKNEKYLLVENVLETLQDLARHHRKHLPIACIAVTGSNGKTTTKELLTLVLAKKYRTQATIGNYNNHIGVPLTILDILPNTEMAIVEMGANHADEINFLCSVAYPNFGLITNIGKAHLEGFGSIEGVAKAKGELFEFLEGAEGRVFLNLNDERLAAMGYYIHKVATYGTGRWAKTNGKVIGKVPYLTVRWWPRKKKKTDDDIPPIDIKTNLVGIYNLDNVLAAIAVGTHFQVPPEDIKAAIEDYRPTNNRSQTLKLKSNTFILDAYNANPSSMSAALQNFEQIEAAKKVVILGDMLEMGEYSHAEHLAILKQVEKMNLQHIILVGKEFGKVASEIENVLHFENAVLAKAWFEQQDFSDTHFLVKGSRGIALEKVLQKVE